MKMLALILLWTGLTAFPAGAQEGGAPAPADEPVIKVINFTADWCPNCRIVDPRIDEAIARFPDGQIELVELDMTDTKRAGDEKKLRVFADAIRLADRHQAAYLWDWYGGVTGLSAIISADNGEPISCINRALSVDEIEFRLNEAKILTLKAPAGRRKPRGPDCPPPMKG
ncbi:MAG: thiol reductase thioredoxin [Alphaproteobacteria bacterium]|jgi:thiol-disulfide isomerase/thioredoxin|nr:thiol reductase thioredoxin [Alphaproteobacteria bacterium]